jgi:hypothetical protein
MKKTIAVLFAVLALSTVFLGFAQATSQATIGYCDVVCCPEPWTCRQTATNCYCDWGPPEVTNCWDYCDQSCGASICVPD